MSDNKITVLTLGDHPFFPSGVAGQTKYICEALLDSGKFKIVSLGGAVDHPNYDPVGTDKYKDDWIICPVKGYGTQQVLRQKIYQIKPDIIWFMTDPRFYEWLWHMEDEVRTNVPMIYYHVWDNYPYPTFNDKFYSSNDKVATISKVTSDIVRTVSPNVEEQYIPHAVDSTVFQKLSGTDAKEAIKKLRAENEFDDKFVFFWNNRNARRKQSGSIIWWFKDVLDKIGHDKAILLMHTDVNDDHGQPLAALVQELGLEDQVKFSTTKVDPMQLAGLYNMADCTINISDAEGFGLATLESLSCETPIIVNMTGGLQEQVTDGEDWFGIGIEPSSKAVIGSMACPFIYEDRLDKEDFINACVEMYSKSEEDRRELGRKGREHVVKNYNFKDFKSAWVKCMLDLHEEHGSWETRKNYTKWRVVSL